MKKREFLKSAAVVGAGTLAAPSLLVGCADSKEGNQEQNGTAQSTAAAEFTLPELPYATNALEAAVDQQTMEIHHGKHHAGYVRKLNAALEGSSLIGKPLEEIVAQAGQHGAGIRNNGGGHYNHSLFWQIMSPSGGGEPNAELMAAINGSFGSYAEFAEKFETAAAKRFGSGWAWLCVGANKNLFVSSTPNQDNPVMDVAEEKGTPILGLDVWEHAYYLRYQNKRKEYIGNFWKVVNWEEVAKRHSQAIQGA